MITPGDEVRGPSHDVPDVVNIARLKKTDNQSPPRKRKHRRKKTSGDQIAAGQAQHDITANGKESVDHSVDYLA